MNVPLHLSLFRRSPRSLSLLSFPLLSSAATEKRLTPLLASAAKVTACLRARQINFFFFLFFAFPPSEGNAK